MITKYKLNKEDHKKLTEAATELYELCQAMQVPAFISLAVANDEKKTTYFNRLFGAKVHSIELKDDRIEPLILVANGFSAVPPREAVTLDMGTGTTDGGTGHGQKKD